MTTRRATLSRGLRSLMCGLVAAILPCMVTAVDAPSCPADFADTPGIPVHMSQADITAGNLTFLQVRDHGKALFTAVPNVCDGVGRPGTNACTAPRPPANNPLFHRISGPDANSCAGCHNQPRVGGAGDVVMNRFFPGCEEAVVTALDPAISVQHGTPGMFGSGLIQMLAIEMTNDIKAGLVGLPDGWHTITTKGVNFEFLIAGGKVTGAVGLEADVAMKVSPFEVDGRVHTIRSFSANSFNEHHGLQPDEMFTNNPRSLVNDQDGIEHEITEGDMNAVTVFQASLGIPVQVLPTDAGELARVTHGQTLFNSVGCAACHIPALTLNSSMFNDGLSLRFDMTRTGEAPLAQSNGSGGVTVRAYTDLKWHNLCDHEDHPDPIRFFCNETSLIEDPRKDGHDWTRTLRPGAEFFITRKLWDVGNSAGYGHAGNLPTLHEAIVAHAGEARATRDAYVALSRTDKEDIVLFLKTLQAPEKEGAIFDNGVLVRAAPP